MIALSSDTSLFCKFRIQSTGNQSPTFIILHAHLANIVYLIFAKMTDTR